MNIMNLNDEQRKRLEEELQSLRNTPVKPCRWIKNHIDYSMYWVVGFICGMTAGWRLKE